MAEKAGIHAKAQESKQRCSSSCKQKPKLYFSESSADRVLLLQRTAGNQAVQKLIKSGVLQAKSRISQSYDLCEQKARKEGTINSIRYESCKQKRILQRGSINLAPRSVPPIVHEVLKSPGQPLDSGTREFMELRFGNDFSKVRVHTDANAAESVREVNALAYTVGKDVVLGEGEYAPETAAGRKLLAHELTHVVQQSKSDPSLSTLRIGSPHDNAEAEASTASEKVISGNVVNTTSFMPAQSLQRAYVEEHAAGCGVCEEEKEAGKRAHTLVQSEFRAFPSITTETPLYYPDDKENGRLDLLRIIRSPPPPYETYVDIGEIKPYNSDGVKRGHKDLAFYRGKIDKSKDVAGVSRSSFEVGFLDIPAPKMPLAFNDPTSKCDGQALIVEGPFDGLYLYSCQPPRSIYPKEKCCEKERMRRPVPIPFAKEAEEKESKKEEQKSPVGTHEPIPVPARQPVSQAAPTGFDAEQLKKNLINIGIPVALITTVMALVVVAIVDPEPFSKLATGLAALLGISAVAATAIALIILRKVKPESREVA